MLQHSKILKSRDEWRDKAVIRSEENKELRKTKKRHQDKIAQLKTRLKELTDKATKKNT